MRNHKCGTCRFYQEAQLASSGWCHHPQRKTTSDIMIMVRKNELACRDEWAHDLWEPKSAQPGTPAAAPGQFSDRKERPATEAEIAAILAANSSSTYHDHPASAGASDIVLSELGAGPEPNTYVERLDPPPEWAQTSSRPVEPTATPSPSGDHSSTARGAIIRAREAYRERSRQVTARSKEIARLASNLPPAAPLTSDSTLPDRPGFEAVAQISAQPPAATQNKTSETVAVPSTPPQPEVDEIVLARAEADDASGQESASETHRSIDDPLGPEPDRPEWMDDLDEAASQQTATGPDSPRSSSPEPSATPRQGFEDALDFGRATERDEPITSAREGHQLDWDRTHDASVLPGHDAVAPKRGNEHGTNRQGYAEPPHYWSASDQMGTRYGQRHEPARDAYPASEFNDAYSDTVHDQYDEFAATSRSIDLEANLDVEPSAVIDNEPVDHDVVVGDDYESDVVIPLRPALSADLPRICRTCRDFRPAETSDRGWCANQWAFSHRRVVAANESVPCESVIGNWWLPADEVWSDAADVSSHGQPTPLLDAWLPEYQENEPSRRRS